MKKALIEKKIISLLKKKGPFLKNEKKIYRDTTILKADI